MPAFEKTKLKLKRLPGENMHTKRVYRIGIISRAQQVADHLKVDFDVPDDMPDNMAVPDRDDGGYPYIILEATYSQARQFLMAIGYVGIDVDNEIARCAGEEVR